MILSNIVDILLDFGPFLIDARLFILHFLFSNFLILVLIFPQKHFRIAYLRRVVFVLLLLLNFQKLLVVQIILLFFNWHKEVLNIARVQILCTQLFIVLLVAIVEVFISCIRPYFRQNQAAIFLQLTGRGKRRRGNHA